jgi:hypothetical protein
MPQPKGVGVLAPRLNPPHAQKTLQSSLKSPDRLLGTTCDPRLRAGHEKIGAGEEVNWSGRRRHNPIRPDPMIFRNDRLRCANLTCDHDDLHISFQSAAACRFKQRTLCQCDDVACEMCARKSPACRREASRRATWRVACAFRSIQVAQKMKTGLVALPAGSLVVSRR